MNMEQVQNRAKQRIAPGGANLAKTCSPVLAMETSGIKTGGFYAILQ